MWLYIFVIPLAIILIIGGLLAGGVYTIVFLPIAVIIAVGSILYTMWASSQRSPNLSREREQVSPLPHTGHANTAATPSSPEQLTDARRAEQ